MLKEEIQIFFFRDEYFAKAYNNESLMKLLKRESQRTTNIIICTAVFVIVLPDAVIACMVCWFFYSNSYEISNWHKKWKITHQLCFHLQYYLLL